jgi:hypothetical protein
MSYAVTTALLQKCEIHVSDKVTKDASIYVGIIVYCVCLVRCECTTIVYIGQDDLTAYSSLT